MFGFWWRRRNGRRFPVSASIVPAARRRFRPVLRLEPLEDRLLLDAAPVWTGYANNAQHTAISTVASQSLGIIRWQTPVDLHPQYSGGELLIHYGSPLVTASNTVIVPVKTGTAAGYRLEGHSGADGTLLWTQTADYLLPPHYWTPSFGPTLTPTNHLYYAGAGGTIYVIDNPNAPGSAAPTHLAFYGIDNYNPATFDNAVYINTPITADAAGNIYFGFQVTATPGPLGLRSGIARIDPSGNGTWIAASTAAADATITKVVHNCAPALSNDGSVVYVAVNNTSGAGFGFGYMLALNSTTLQPLGKVRLKDPGDSTGQTDAYLPDDGTSSPTVGPNGDVYFGVLDNPTLTDKGWLLHFSGDLSQVRTPPGAFGWDDTASIVPSTMVPSYHGSSTYLLMTKYNNYAGIGGDGVNKIAVLDPNDSQVDARTHVTVMKEVLTIAGQTPDPEYIGTHPNAVREWCINNAVVDPFTDSILANSEDGKLYRWDLSTNTFSQVITLTSGIGEAYTPTLIGADGTVYAINNATLYAVKRAAPAVVSSTPSGNTLGTVSSVRVTFDEAIDASTFTLGQVATFTRTVGSTVTDLSGALLGVTPVAGNRSFDITFTSQSTLGNYRLVLGPNILDTMGRPMDQNGNGILGEVPGDQYTASFTIQGLRVVSAVPNSFTAGQVSSIRVTFNEPIDVARSLHGEFSLIGPDGSHRPTGVIQVAGSGGTQFDITFDPLTVAGRYTMVLGPHVYDLNGDPMDQDGDLIPGESTDAFTASGVLSGPRVTGADALSGLPVAGAIVAFDRPMNPTSITSGSFAVAAPDGSALVVTAVMAVSGSSNRQFEVDFAPSSASGTYTVTVHAGILDIYGNALTDDFTISFNV
jgi:hypothetical protein